MRKLYTLVTLLLFSMVTLKTTGQPNSGYQKSFSVNAFSNANLQSDEKLTIEIFDVTGQVIKSVDQPKLNAGINSISINASELSNGIYFLKIYNETVDNISKFIINK